MPNYSTITSSSSNRNPGRSSTAGNMARPRRPKSRGGDGGGQASIMSSNINLLNTIVGAGTLAMPAAMSHMSVTLGAFVIFWSGLTSAFGLYLQSRCARYLDRGTSSFFALSQITYPNAAVLFDAAIAVKCFGVGVSYLIIIGDLMPGVVLGFSASIGADMPFLVDRNFWITAFMLVIIPLAFLRRLDSLKYTSVIALVSIGYLIVLVVYHFYADKHASRRDVHLVKWHGPVALLSSLPVVIFAYTCHQNMFSILNELRDNSPMSVVTVIGSSIGSAASIYVLVAITGYLTFGSKVVGNIVSMYPPNFASTVGKAAIVVLVTFSVPLQIHPARASIDAVLKWRPGKSSSAVINNRREANNASTREGSGASLLPTSSGPSSSAPAPALDSHGSPVAAPMPEMRFAIITTVIIIGSYMTALSVSSLDRVLAYVGSTGSTSISFILPGLFYYKISDPDSEHHQRLMKEDDDADVSGGIDYYTSDASDDETEIEANEQALLGGSIVPSNSGYVGTTAAARRLQQLLRRKRMWRWDLEHLEHGLLRKMALGLAIYGMIVMIVCLGMNLFFTVAH